jgi:choline dehydrogenase-like flavoprotein
LNGRQIEVVRGKVLGGFFFSKHHGLNPRASRRFRSLGASRSIGWSYADLLPYFKRAESFEGGETPWRGETDLSAYNGQRSATP